MEQKNILKRVQIGGRMPAEIYQKFTTEMADKGLSQTQLLEIILTQYYDGTMNEKIVEVEKPVEVEKIVEVERPRGDWDLNILDCKSVTIGAFLEIMDKQQTDNKPAILDAFVTTCEKHTGKVEDKYIMQAYNIKPR